MKKNILTLIALVTVLFSACKKENNNNPGDNNGGGTTAGSYQPFTNGSTWSYRNESAAFGDSPAEVDTTTNTMTATTKVINGKTFHLAKAVTGTETLESYFGYKDNIYYSRSVMGGTEGDMEIPYLNESSAVGTTWTLPIEIEDAPGAQVKGTITEKGISKTVQGKTYNNVIHSKIEVQAPVAGQLTTLVTLDFYVAKNVGVIGIYTSYLGSQVTKSELINYSIK